MALFVLFYKKRFDYWANELLKSSELFPEIPAVTYSFLGSGRNFFVRVLTGVFVMVVHLWLELGSLFSNHCPFAEHNCSPAVLWCTQVIPVGSSSNRQDLNARQIQFVNLTPPVLVLDL